MLGTGSLVEQEGTRNTHYTYYASQSKQHTRTSSTSGRWLPLLGMLQLRDGGRTIESMYGVQTCSVSRFYGIPHIPLRLRLNQLTYYLSTDTAAQFARRPIGKRNINHYVKYYRISTKVL